MRLAIHPYVFLGGSVALCALWLWIRPPLPAVPAAPPARSPRPAPIERPSIKLDAATLERYVGTYRGRAEFTVELTLKNGRLMADGPQTPPFELLPTSETEFFLVVPGAQDVGVDVKFSVENGVVKGFAASTELGVIYVDRVR